jgi:hypothetical protein
LRNAIADDPEFQVPKELLFQGNEGPAAANAPGAAAAAVPPAATEYLKSHPELRDQFEAKYGAGSAASVLGK